MAGRELEESSARLADNADKLGQTSERIEDSADRRTSLAADRTVFAAERTYAAWMRTGLVALASGIGARELLGEVLPDWATLLTGSMLVLFAVFCFGAAGWRQLHPGAPPPRPDVPRLPPVVLGAFALFLGIVAVAVLVGLWLGGTP
jgi:putative membrane protein